MTAVPHVLVVEPESAGQRLDVFLTSHLENTSRARVQQLISQDKVLVNRRQEKASFKLRGSEQIDVMDEVTREPLRAIALSVPSFDLEWIRILLRPSSGPPFSCCGSLLFCPA